MGGRSVEAAPSVRRQYFQTLGVEDAQAIERDITVLLINAVRKRRGNALPVRLAGAVEEFLIESEPRWDEAVPHGRLEFDDAKGHFVVRLGTRWNKPDINRIPNDHLARGLGRLRFTYAHEVAHRFFFVRSGNSWRRALDVVANALPEGNVFRARRVLTRLEESLCNTIAGKVLIPSDKLAEVCTQYRGFSTDTEPLFCAALTSAARLFAVTRKCFMVRLRKAIEQGEVSVGENFCALLCGISSEQGSSRSQLRMRVSVPIIPSRLGNYQLVRKFNGMAVENFGEALFIFCSHALKPETRSSGTLQVPLQLRAIGENRSEFDVGVRMEGNWNKLSSGEVLVWGRLQLDE